MRARDVMQTQVATVAPEMTLVDLERRFLERRVTGFPVVRQGRLVGIVSRSDIVRRLGVEQSLAESLSDYYREVGAFEVGTAESLESIGRRVGERLENLRVEDVMIHAPITVSPDRPLRDVARVLLEHRIHRVPVVEGDRLAGIVTTFDLVRWVAEQA